MGGESRVARCWVLAMLVLAGCKMGGPGESTIQQCDDEEDNDNDGLFDCDDPGCRALEVCNDAAVPMIPPPPPPTMFGDSTTTLPLGGSSAPMMSVPDAGPDLDAGEEPPPQQPPVIEEPPPPCDGLCTATQSCNSDNECIDITAPMEGNFELRVVSARVPARGAFGLCLDMDCSFPFDLSCRCAPDPLVRVLRVRQPPTDGAEVEVIEIGRTVTIENDVTPTFPAEGYPLELEPGDALRFEVWDADPELDTAQFVFECRPNLRELKESRIGCSEVAIGAEGSVLAEVLEVR